MNKKIISVLVALTLVLGFAGIALANDGAFADFNAQYPGKSYGCSLCHTSPPTLNPYGQALAANGATGGNINPATFVTVEPLDSDGDTFSNLAEITANTLPGDATSFPAVPIVVTSPNGSEVIPAGTTSAVTYTAPAEVASVKVKYSLDNGVTWVTAVDAGGSVPGTFNWAVPTPIKNKTNALVKVIGFNASSVKVGADRSNAVFTIETATITAPAAAAIVSAPSTIITWTTNGLTVDSFVLHYSTDNGTTWKKIFQSAAGSGNPGTYTWDAASLKPIPTPANPKTKSKIRLLLKDSAGATIGKAVSDKFTIQ